MNDLINNSIKSRKDAIFNVYDVKDKKLLKEIDDLFARIADFGNDYDDLGSFETSFASSPLNQEYIDLFTKISQSSEYILKEADTEPTDVKSDGEYMAEEIASDAKYVVKDATLPFRRKAREHVTGKLRNTPIIGDVLNVKQHMDLFGGFKRKKKYKEEQEALQKELDEQMNNK